MRWKNAEFAGWGRALTARCEVARPERRRALETLLSEGLAPAMGMRTRLSCPIPATQQALSMEEWVWAEA